METEIGEEGQAGRQCESAHMAAVTTRRSLATAKVCGLLSKATFWEEIRREAMKQLSPGDGELVPMSLLQTQHSAGCNSRAQGKIQRWAMVKPQG